MNDLPTWSERSREHANLLNPAFLALMIQQLAVGHEEKTGRGLPWVLAYVGLPVVLHKPTRDELPPSVTTSMAVWTRRHPFLVAGLGSRAGALRDQVSEGLFFGLAHGMLERDGKSLRKPHPAARWPRGLPRRAPTADFRSCNSAATMFGRWAAQTASTATVLALWGVRP